VRDALPGDGLSGSRFRANLTYCLVSKIRVGFGRNREGRID